jgi:hypothetical protein
MLIATERPQSRTSRRSGEGADRGATERPRSQVSRRSSEGADRADRGQREVKHLLGILALFVVAYLVMVLATNVFLDASTSLEGRLLVPVQVAGGLLVVGLVHRALVFRAGATVAAVAVVVVLVWCAWPARAIVKPFGSWSTIEALDDGFPARARSPLAEAAAKLPPGTLLASNVPANVFFDTGRNVIFLPPKQYLVAGERNPDFSEQARQLGRILATRHGDIVLYDDFNAALPSAADLGKHMTLVEVGRFRDGVLYRVAARS